MELQPAYLQQEGAVAILRINQAQYKNCSADKHLPLRKIPAGTGGRA